MPDASGISCPSCGYSLPSLDAGEVCPECGVDVGKYSEAFAIASSPKWYVRRMVESMIIIAVCSVWLAFGDQMGRAGSPWWATPQGTSARLLWHGVPAVLWVVSTAKMLWPPPNARTVQFPRWVLIPGWISLAIATPWPFHEFNVLLQSYWEVSVPLPGLRWQGWQFWTYVVGSIGIQATQLYIGAWLLERCVRPLAMWWMLLSMFPAPVVAAIAFPASLIPAALLIWCAVLVHRSYSASKLNKRTAAA